MTEAKTRETPDPATSDELTGLLNRTGLEPLAEYRFRLSDRTRVPVTLVFLRLTPPGEASAELLVEVAEVIRGATREADLSARLDEGFCVLLAGNATGAEAAVLSRIVEGLAEHNARSDRPVPLSLAIGTAAYEPGNRRSLDQVLEEAATGMRDQGPGTAAPS
ncbi:MAG: diguanylate cyclase [Actinomycetota bacterium]